MDMNTKRESAILLPIFSLPSKYGIGTLGKEAFRFADFLKSAGQRCWQILPLGPTMRFGHSPYSSFSAYAGNPYLIDLELLCEDGLLDERDVEAVDWGDDPRNVDYGKLYEHRLGILRKAFDAGCARDHEEIREFEAENRLWLPDYALFMALKAHFGMAEWTEWADEGIRLRKGDSVAQYTALLQEDIRFFTYLQYVFYKQWNALRGYVNSLGIKLIGDLPIYVALDSSDVWASPQYFMLNAQNLPIEVAGVPPDYFSEDGQLWDNPLYNWARIRADGYDWWIHRVEGARRLYDTIRIDHFRGFESFWCVPYGAATAKGGRWERGPGMGLIRALKNRFPDISIIAEDLGYMTPEVKELLIDSGFPGMKVLQPAFDSREPNRFPPHTFERHCVCYIGTHDNQTMQDWLETADPDDVACAKKYLGLNDEEGYIWGMLRGGMSSVADLFVVQMQDCLGLGADCRMNVPGTATGNWRWRLLPGEADEALAAKLLDYTKMYGRST